MTNQAVLIVFLIPPLFILTIKAKIKLFILIL